MSTKLFCSLVSLACFIYARHLNLLPKEGLTKEGIRERMNNITFYSLFGTTALMLSFF